MWLNHHRTGSGPPLVLIHGIGHRWQGWRPVIDRLEAEREIVALDLPGFGASPMAPPDTPPGVGSLASLVAGFLAEMGLDRPHLAGNSLGGWISLELARRGVARSATGVSPAGFHTPREATFQHGSLTVARALARLTADRATTILARPGVRRLVLAQLAAHPERIGVAEAAADVRALADAPWFGPTLRAINREGFAGGETIDVPVTIAWGEQDRLLLPRQAERAQRMMPRARMVVLRGCGHVPMADDPDQVAEAIRVGSA